MKLQFNSALGLHSERIYQARNSVVLRFARTYDLFVEYDLMPKIVGYDEKHKHRVT